MILIENPLDFLSFVLFENRLDLTDEQSFIILLCFPGDNITGNLEETPSSTAAAGIIHNSGPYDIEDLPSFVLAASFFLDSVIAGNGMDFRSRLLMNIPFHISIPPRILHSFLIKML
jgi:hypothetical protein